MVKPVKFTFEEMSGVIHYDAEEGEFSWKVTTSSRGKAGGRAGVWLRLQNGKDYYCITYKGRKMSGAQVAWLLHYGEWPDRTVFYIDGNTRNLAIANLKLAEHKAIKITDADGKSRYKMTEEQVRHYGLRRHYDLSLTEYAQMFAAQGGVCAICKKPETAKLPGRKTESSENRTRDLSVDHCHKTGRVRQLLCNACNHILGEAKDDPEVLSAAAEYLKRHLSETETMVE